MEQKNYDIIIIGGGPGGLTASIYAQRAGLKTLIIEKAIAGGQITLTPEIENYPGYENIDGFTLGNNMKNSAVKFGAKIINTEVKSVDFSEKLKKVTVKNEELFAKTVIISTGAEARKLGLKNEESFIGKGVSYCAHCDGMFFRGKTVVVAGGGNSAVSDALYLSNICSKVYIVHRRDKLRASKIYNEKIFKRDNIEILWNTKITDFIGEERISGLMLENTKDQSISKLSCDGVFVSIGRTPETKLFKDILDIDEDGYILSDETTKTNIDGVFAVGDVRKKELRQIVTAVSDGAVSAHFAEKYIEETE